MNDNDGLDTRLQQLYQRIPKEQPSAKIDTVILQAAQQAIVTKTYWRPVWGIAASVLMASSLVWYWQAQQPDELAQAVAVSQPKAVPAEAPTVVINAVKIEERAVMAADDFTDDTPQAAIVEKKVTVKKPAEPLLQDKSLLGKSENLALKEELKQSPAAAPALSIDMQQIESDSPLVVPQVEKAKTARMMAASPSLTGSSVSERERKSEELSATLNETQDVSRNNQSKLERVRWVFEKNYPALNTIYQQAFNESPHLEQGVVRFKLIIDKEGNVKSCTVASSDLNYSELEDKFVEIVKKFKFGKASEEWKGTYPVYFYHQ